MSTSIRIIVLIYGSSLARVSRAQRPVPPCAHGRVGGRLGAILVGRIIDSMTMNR